jgi:hypothetical protein
VQQAAQRGGVIEADPGTCTAGWLRRGRSGGAWCGAAAMPGRRGGPPSRGRPPSADAAPARPLLHFDRRADEFSLFPPEPNQTDPL